MYVYAFPILLLYDDECTIVSFISVIKTQIHKYKISMLTFLLLSQLEKRRGQAVFSFILWQQQKSKQIILVFGTNLLPADPSKEKSIM